VLLRDSLRHDLLGGEIPHLARELDLVVAGHLAGVLDHEVIALEIQLLDEEDSVLGDLPLFDRNRTLVAAASLALRRAGQLLAVDLEGEDVLLDADLGVELGLPFSGDVGCAGEPGETECGADCQRIGVFMGV